MKNNVKTMAYILDSDSEEEIQVIEPTDPLSLENELKAKHEQIDYKQEELDIPADNPADWDEEDSENENSEKKEETLDNPNPVETPNCTQDVIDILSDDEDNNHGGDNDTQIVLQNFRKQFPTCKTTAQENQPDKSANNKPNNISRVTNRRKSATAAKNRSKTAAALESGTTGGLSDPEAPVKSEFGNTRKVDEKKVEEFIIGDFDYPSDEEINDQTDKTATESMINLKKIVNSTAVAWRGRGVRGRWRGRGRGGRGRGGGVSQTDKTPLFKCRFCSKSFTSRSGLSLHEVLHTDRFKCPMCNRRFQNLSTLLNHERSNHSNNLQKFICTICNLEFIRPKNYLLHMDSMHPGVLPSLSEVQPSEVQEQIGNLPAVTNNNGNLNRVPTDRICNCMLNTVPEARICNCMPNTVPTDRICNCMPNTIATDRICNCMPKTIPTDRICNCMPNTVPNARICGCMLNNTKCVGTKMNSNLNRIPEVGNFGGLSMVNNKNSQKFQCMKKGAGVLSNNEIGDVVNGSVINGCNVWELIPSKRRRIYIDNDECDKMKQIMKKTVKTMQATLEKQNRIPGAAAPTTAFVIDQHSEGNNLKTQVKQVTRCPPPVDNVMNVINAVAVGSSQLLYKSDNFPLDTDVPLLLVVEPGQRSQIVADEGSPQLRKDVSSNSPDNRSKQPSVSKISIIGTKGVSSNSPNIGTKQPNPSIYCTPASVLFPPKDVPKDISVAKSSTSIPHSESVNETHSTEFGSTVVPVSKIVPKKFHAHVSASNKNLRQNKRVKSTCNSDPIVFSGNGWPSGMDNGICNSNPISFSGSGWPSGVDEGICNSDPINFSGDGLHQSMDLSLDKSNEQNLVITSTMSVASLESLNECLPSESVFQTPSSPSNNSACSESFPHSPLPPELIDAKLEVEMEVIDIGEPPPLEVIADTGEMQSNSLHDSEPPAKVRRIGNSASIAKPVLVFPSEVNSELPTAANNESGEEAFAADARELLNATPISFPTAATVLTTASATVFPIAATAGLPTAATTGFPTAPVAGLPNFSSISSNNSYTTKSTSHQVAAPINDDDIVEIRSADGKSLKKRLEGKSPIASESSRKSTYSRCNESVKIIDNNKQESFVSEDDTEDDCVFLEEIPVARRQDASCAASVPNDYTDDCVLIEERPSCIQKVGTVRNSCIKSRQNGNYSIVSVNSLLSKKMWSSIISTDPPVSSGLVSLTPATVSSSPATVSSSPATLSSSPATASSALATVSSSSATVSSTSATVKLSTGLRKLRKQKVAALKVPIKLESSGAVPNNPSATSENKSNIAVVECGKFLGKSELDQSVKCEEEVCSKLSFDGNMPDCETVKDVSEELNKPLANSEDSGVVQTSLAEKNVVEIAEGISNTSDSDKQVDEEIVDLEAGSKQLCKNVENSSNSLKNLSEMCSNVEKYLEYNKKGIEVDVQDYSSFSDASMTILSSVDKLLEELCNKDGKMIANGNKYVLDGGNLSKSLQNRPIEVCSLMSDTENIDSINSAQPDQASQPGQPSQPDQPDQPGNEKVDSNNSTKCGEIVDREDRLEEILLVNQSLSTKHGSPKILLPNSDESLQKSYDVVQKSDNIVEKVGGVVRKSDEVVKISVEIDQKSYEFDEKSIEDFDKLVVEKVNERVEKSVEGLEKSVGVVENSDDSVEKSGDCEKITNIAVKDAKLLETVVKNGYSVVSHVNSSRSPEEHVKITYDCSKNSLTSSCKHNENSDYKISGQTVDNGIDQMVICDQNLTMDAVGKIQSVSDDEIVENIEICEEVTIKRCLNVVEINGGNVDVVACNVTDKTTKSNVVDLVANNKTDHTDNSKIMADTQTSVRSQNDDNLHVVKDVTPNLKSEEICCDLPEVGKDGYHDDCGNPLDDIKVIDVCSLSTDGMNTILNANIGKSKTLNTLSDVETSSVIDEKIIDISSTSTDGVNTELKENIDEPKTLNTLSDVETSSVNDVGVIGASIISTDGVNTVLKASINEPKTLNILSDVEISSTNDIGIIGIPSTSTDGVNTVLKPDIDKPKTLKSLSNVETEIVDNSIEQSVKVLDGDRVSKTDDRPIRMVPLVNLLDPNR